MKKRRCLSVTGSVFFGAICFASILILRGGLVVDRVAGRAHSADIIRSELIERLAQTADVNVNRAGLNINIYAPHIFEQKLSGKHFFGLFHQHPQQAKLRRSEMDVVVAAINLFGDQIHTDVLKHQFLVVMISGARRILALTRAISSGIENGLVT